MRPSRRVAAPGILPAVAALVTLVCVAAPELQGQVRFAVTEIRIEVNATDGDAGIQVDLDGEAWREVTIFSPDGRRLLVVGAEGNLEKLGLTELFFESEEPSFDELPLRDLLRMFPEGEYRFVGRTVEGERIVGVATLTHDIPAGPVILSPREGQRVDPDHTVIVWVPVTRPQGIEIVRYQVIVEREEPTPLQFSVDLPASVTSVTVPPEFLQPGTEYDFEVLAIEAGGNQTITESSFETARGD
ncbi:MAG: fibronectin type III domain-containing protein [Gemmatimonadota bacterium]